MSTTTTTVMAVAMAAATAHRVAPMRAASAASKATAAILGVDTLDVFASTELTDDQAAQLAAALADRFGATVTGIAR